MRSLDCTGDGHALAAALAERDVQRVTWRNPWNPGMADLDAAVAALASQPLLDELSLTVDAVADEDAARIASLPRLSALRVEVAADLTAASVAALGRAALRALALGDPRASTLPLLAAFPSLARLELDEMYPTFGEPEGRAVAALPALTELVLTPHHLVATSVRRDGLLALAPLAPRLRVLIVDDCWEVDDSIADLLLTFERLDHLAIRRTRIGPHALAQLTRRIQTVEA